MLKRLRYVRKRGFSLLELMIAIALFLTSFCMIIGIFPVTFRSVQMSKENLIASNIAEEKLEYAKSLPFDQLTSTNPPNGGYVLYNKVNGIQQNLSYNFYYIITSVSTELKDVKVSVTWSDSTGAHDVVLQTRVAKLN